jgi:hypothetical protein
VVVDPRRSETARNPDLHLAIRPGTDPALLAFLVREVLQHRLQGWARSGAESLRGRCTLQSSHLKGSSGAAPTEIQVCQLL